MSVASTTKNVAKQAVKKKIKKWVMTAIAPFIPYIIFISALFMARSRTVLLNITYTINHLKSFTEG